jgi:cytochrome c oxidase cbb3-type subunit III
VSDGLSIDKTAARKVGLAIAGLLVLAIAAFLALKPKTTPPPASIANDPLLVKGREVYLDRCVSCHGTQGEGDGPIAKGLKGSPVGDLTAPRWKHGDTPAQAIEVVSLGVPNTNMAAWGRTLGGENVRAVTAYVYFLAGRAMPEELRH